MSTEACSSIEYPTGVVGQLGHKQEINQMIYSLGERKVEFRGDYYVAPSASVIGSVVLGHNASVWFNCVLRGDNDIITIGDNSNVQDASVLHVDEGVPLHLGANVSIGHKVMLHGCSVDDNSLIGMNAVILNNARIGKNCLVGASALVTEGKEIPDGSLVLGSPARVARSLTKAEIKSISRIVEHYVQKSALYRKSLREHP
jgi:carbonic anhydrase/acetyltransferase-like protein (isoleucine patch superfamily)